MADIPKAKSFCSHSFSNRCHKSEQFDIILQHIETNNYNNSMYLLWAKIMLQLMYPNTNWVWVPVGSPLSMKKGNIFFHFFVSTPYLRKDLQNHVPPMVTAIELITRTRSWEVLFGIHILPIDKFMRLTSESRYVTFCLHFAWTFCSHRKLHQILTGKNSVKYSKNLSPNKRRPSFIARPITRVKMCWLHPG